MGNIDELFEEDLDFAIGGITATDINKEINLIATSNKPIEEKKRLINEIKHKILTGKINPKDNSSSRKI